VVSAWTVIRLATLLVLLTRVLLTGLLALLRVARVLLLLAALLLTALLLPLLLTALSVVGVVAGRVLVTTFVGIHLLVLVLILVAGIVWHELFLFFSSAPKVRLVPLAHEFNGRDAPVFRRR
jgi:hypothetical protein